MKSFKQLGAVLGLLFVCLVCFTGCKAFGKTVYFATNCGRNEVFKIGNLKCDKSEALVYLANYKNLYGNVNGTSLWTDEYDTAKMQDSMKDAVVEHLTKIYVLNQYAIDNEITLSDKEIEAVKSAAEEYYNSLNKAEKKYTGASKSDILDMYERYAIAMKVYYELMGTVDEEVSEDEARVMEALVFYVSDKNTAESIASRIARGESFETIANSFNEGSGMVRVSFGRNTYPEAVEAEAFKLDNDEKALNIDDGEGKYYFVYCLNKYDEVLSEENKTNVVTERQKKVVEDIIDNLDEKYYSAFNSKLWKKIYIDSNEEIETDSFFSVLDEYVDFH